MTSDFSDAGDAAGLPAAFLVFYLGKKKFGLDARKVRELQDYDALTKLVEGGRVLEEVVVWRNNVVPIVDLRIRFNFGMPEYQANTSVIIMEAGAGIIGLVVDRLAEVVTLMPHQIRPVPVAGSAVNCLLGLATHEGDNLILVDIEQMLGRAGVGGNQKLR